MTSWLSMMMALLWLTSTSAQFGSLKSLTGSINKELTTFKDPINKLLPPTAPLTDTIQGLSNSITKEAGVLKDPIEKLPASAQVNGALQGLTSSVTNEVLAVKDPVDKTVFYVAFSQCKHVKRILGFDYEQYSKEPDYSKLSLIYITEAVQTRYNLSHLVDISSNKQLTPRNGLIVYMHGFIEDPYSDSYRNVNTAFLQKGHSNILALDASSLIGFIYLRASTMVRFIGEQLAAALANMVHAGLDPRSIHLIGHSLGSHIAGFTGKTFLELTGRQVGRISGLDPAGPCFADVDPNLRLSKADAEFVDVIHTDANVYGLSDQVGHVDFYPNSGSEQPQCLLQVCSHSRAWLLYAESVNNTTGFPAVACNSWVDFKKGVCDQQDVSYMGYAAKPSKSSKYYLQTGEETPFALGAAGTTHRNRDAVIRELRDHVGLWSS